MLWCSSLQWCCHKHPLAHIFATKPNWHLSLQRSCTGIPLCYEVILTSIFATKSHLLHLCYKATLAKVFAIKPYWHWFLQWIHTGIYLWNETILVRGLKEWIIASFKAYFEFLHLSPNLFKVWHFIILLAMLSWGFLAILPINWLNIPSSCSEG